jgi:beta-fructofuranosidase
MDRRNFLLLSTACALNIGSPMRLHTLEDDVRSSDAALRDKLVHDPLRPQFHLLPQAGFVGDPCAPRFFKGKYHVFFHGSFDGQGWHHATSSDLIHWEHMPIALSPTPNSYDSYGCFTGSILNGTEVPSIIYAGVTKSSRERETIRGEGLREVQCIATSADADLRTWKKLDMPVISPDSVGEKIVGFRDPFSWKEGDIWYVGVGSGFPQRGGAVLLYRSNDARRWQYLHPLAQGTWNGKSFTNPVGTGEMWECPDFFPLGNKHVLIYSTEYVTHWEVGTYDKREVRFCSERRGFLDHGAYYAPKSMLDNKGRRILWGWVQEARSQEAVRTTGWSGAISLPRVLSICTDDELRMEVPSEFASLRASTVVVKEPRDSRELEEANSRTIIHNRAGEVICIFKTDRLDYGIELVSGTPANRVLLMRISNGVSIGNTPTILVDDRTLALNPDDQGHSTLHIWIDGSVIELFVDAKQVMTVRCYDVTPGFDDIRVRWAGAAESLVSLEVSDITPISRDRLTT